MLSVLVFNEAEDNQNISLGAYYVLTPFSAELFHSNADTLRITTFTYF